MASTAVPSEETAAVDPFASPLADWAGRDALVESLLDLPSAADEEDDSQSISTAVDPDAMNQLRRALDSQFTGVQLAPFGWVAALVAAYVALIGPGDYYLLHRVLKKPPATWATFPLMVVAASGFAWWLAQRMKGGDLRVNQIEIIDVDAATGLTRGTAYTHFFSPAVARRDLAFEPRIGERELDSSADAGEANNRKHADPQGTILASWLGAAGHGLGGMEGRRPANSADDQGYRIDEQLDSLAGFPSRQWSSQTLAGRWTSQQQKLIEAYLVFKPGVDELIQGKLVNRSGVAWQDCVLLHGNWAYPVPPLADGATTKLAASLEPKPVKLALAGPAAGDSAEVRKLDDGSAAYDPWSTDVARIAKRMMFFATLDPAQTAPTPSRFQGFLDMSNHLRGDQAVLLVRLATDEGSQWVEGTKRTPLAGPHDRRWTYLRFVIPVARPAEVTVPLPAERAKTDSRPLTSDLFPLTPPQ